ncbi:hypothetical protein D9619_006581 [Psilocybe cf. subviscida]|uniref:Chromo domain-containing protein n=1 Tax=Psilocybe cf. subviscida TaxID=2480587 RepID=A0A8H5B3J5_9AGAR|nr:hypothetical protein D9619_006581 [Psilocybe cf. subviscida]
MPADKATKNPVEEGDDSGSEEEEEYEIEEVLDAKRGHFPDGRMGYFVKWKGYDETENSWVDEQDAANADDLVKEYWDKHPLKKKVAPRKSIEKKSPPKKASSSRKSQTVEEVSDSESATAKKRPRKSTTTKGADDMDVDSVSAPRPAKKSRSVAARAAAADASDGEEKKIGTMKDYMHIVDWATIVKTIDTVEREGDLLMIYFTLNSGEAVRETSEICKKKFPQKLLDFYESNLRWKAAVDEE